jgi:hypothetical protein
MIPGIVESSRSVNPFVDTFNRANTSDLSTTDVEWTDITGDWVIDTNTAYTTTSASSYPIATFDSQKYNVSLRATNGDNKAGFGVAFWVQDTNNWWALVSDSTTTTGSYSYYTCPQGGYLSGTTCYNTVTEQYIRYYTNGDGCVNNHAYDYTIDAASGDCICNDNCQPCDGTVAPDGNCYQYTYPADAAFCAEIGGTYHSGGTCYFTAQFWCPPYTYQAPGCGPVYGTYTTDYTYAATLATATTTTYTYTIKLIKKVAGTVTTVATQEHGTDTTDGNYINTLSVVTNENQLTLSGVRNGLNVSFSHTAVSPLQADNHGIILAPASRNQGSRIEDFYYFG